MRKLFFYSPSLRSIACVSTDLVFASTLYWQCRLQVVWISRQLLSTITSISARWTQLHQFSLAFTACIHNDACVCECEESGSELSLRHEEREKNHFENEWKWKNDLAAGAQLVCLEFSLSLSFPPFSVFYWLLYIFTLTPSHFIPLCHHMSVSYLLLEWTIICFHSVPSYVPVCSGCVSFQKHSESVLECWVCGSIFIILSLLAGIHSIWGQCFTLLYGLQRVWSIYSSTVMEYILYCIFSWYHSITIWHHH